MTGAVLAWTIAHFLTAFFALAATRFTWVPMPWRKLFDLFNVPLAELALTMGAVQVVNLIAYRAELLVLNHYRSVNEVGVYSISVQTAEMMWLVAGSLATAMTAPCLHESEDDAAKLVRKSAAKTLIYTAGAAVLVGAFVPYAFGPLLGELVRRRLDAAAAPAARRDDLRAGDDLRRLPVHPARAPAPEPGRVGAGPDRDGDRRADPDPDATAPRARRSRARSATRWAPSSRGCSSSACAARSPPPCRRRRHRQQPPRASRR